MSVAKSTQCLYVDVSVYTQRKKKVMVKVSKTFEYIANETNLNLLPIATGKIKIKKRAYLAIK